MSISSCHGRDPSVDRLKHSLEHRRTDSPPASVLLIFGGLPFFEECFVKRTWVSRLAAVGRDTRRILAMAWRMDARLTFLYYLTAFVAGGGAPPPGLPRPLLIGRLPGAPPPPGTHPRSARPAGPP